MLAAGAALLAVAAAVGIVTGCGDDGGDSAEGPAFCPAGEDSGGDSPIGFFGLDSQTSDSAAQYRTMRCGGAHSVRLYVPWGAVNPAPGTYDWSDLDRSVLRAADAELDPLLFVYLTPAWTVQEGDLPAPRSPGRIGATLPVQNATQIAAWQGFLRALVRRYGPDGSLWQAAGAGHRYGPVRLWQIWNEPNLGLFSWPRADPVAFARLQSLGYEAIHDADPGATVLTGGLSAVTVGPAQVDYGRFLAEMIRATPDSQRSFDALAIHPYADRRARTWSGCLIGRGGSWTRMGWPRRRSG